MSLTAKTPDCHSCLKANSCRTRSRVVLSKTSTSFSSLVLAVKTKSSSTHSTYFVVTWETARFRPANQPYDTWSRAWIPKSSTCNQMSSAWVRHFSHLSKGHDVMFDVRPRNGLGGFAVISYDYSDGRIVSSHAVYKILKLIISQESLGSYGNEGTDIVLCREGRSSSRGNWFYCLFDKLKWKDMRLTVWWWNNNMIKGDVFYLL